MTITSEAILLVSASAVIGLLLGWLLTFLYYRRQVGDLKASLEKEETALAEVNQKLLDMSQAYSATKERADLLENLRTQMSDAFKALSANALEQNNRAFLDVAQTLMGKYFDAARTDLDNRNKNVDGMLQPIKKALDKYDEHVSALERARENAFGSLTQQVQSLMRSQQDLQKETGKLVQALQNPQVRGRWGEFTLRRVVELAGMQNHCDFTEQQSVQSKNGLIRPDMIIRLPGERQIVLDAKVSLSAYLEALEADTEDIQKQKLAQHAKHVQAHIQQLSRKAYWTQFQPAPEFVVLFIPGENFFSAALAQLPNLIEEGIQKGVVLSTPITLISLLKTIGFVWGRETAAENAKAISELGRLLFERLVRMTDHLNRLGRDLERSTGTYNQLIGAYERRVLASARKFEELGVSAEGKDSKVLDSLTPIESVPRKTELYAATVEDQEGEEENPPPTETVLTTSNE